MLIHNVYFWLAEDAAQSVHDSLTEGLALLLTDTNVAQGYFGPPGETPKRDVVDTSYSYGLVLLFDDVDSHNRYQVSEIHNEFLAKNKANFVKISVFDIQA